MVKGESLFSIQEISPDSKYLETIMRLGDANSKCFQKYYENSPTGFAIFFRKPFSFDSPIKLKQLREEWSDFRPPQCYHYLKDREINLVQSIAKCDILKLSEKLKVYQTELLPQS
ncbi:hypothetical protein [Nostoc sp.]|uniref:hypothetical protein n=1 Tax=Nostoc sp. TaxID=1180 RepID=UPI002FF9912B